MTAVQTIPRLALTVAGRPLPAEAARALVAVRVQQRLSLPTQCELVFRDPPGPLPAALGPGDALGLRVDGHREALFAGEVTALEWGFSPAGGRELRARAYDLLHRLRKRQEARVHVEVTLRDLARELATPLGLTIAIADPGPRWSRLFQHRQSDLELLQEVADRAGRYLWLHGDVLHLLTPAGLGEPLPLLLGGSLLEARIEVNADRACRAVTATGWDPLRAEVHSRTATRAQGGRVVAASAPPERVGGQGRWHLLDEGTPGDEHAAALAQRELDRRVADEVTFWGVAEGDPRLQPGRPILAGGLAAPLNGRYVLGAVTHTIDERLGFVSELSSALPAPRRRAGGAAVTLGTVTRVDDPADLGRVTVVLPTYGGVETGWLGVLSAGAGSGKGFVILPDVGDQVLVLLAHEDPGQGIVLGGLYGQAGAHDSGVAGGAVRRYTLLTPGGQRIQLDDERGALRLEDRSGSIVELSPDRLLLRAVGRLELEAPGQPVVIRGRSIDFERA